MIINMTMILRTDPVVTISRVAMDMMYEESVKECTFTVKVCKSRIEILERSEDSRKGIILPFEPECDVQDLWQAMSLSW